MRVAIIDHGQANLYSLMNACIACNAEPFLVRAPSQLVDFDAVLLPGVGAFGRAMEALESLCLVQSIREVAAQQMPLLGICLGMQILFETGEEFGFNRGVGLIPGRVKALMHEVDFIHGSKLPHIGWTAISACTEDPLMDGVSGQRMYFAHSYHVVPEMETDVIAKAVYGGVTFAAAVRHGNVWGCQFHPERSADIGLKLIANFLDFSRKWRRK